MLNDPSFVSAQYSQADLLQARITLHKRFSTHPAPWTHWLFDQLSFGQTGRLLEVGCGPADLWIDNQDRWPDGWTFYLSDLYPAMAHKARKRVGLDDGFEYHLADVQSLPHQAAHFDLVVANHMLYHVADPDGALAELARVLKPGGRLVAAANGPGHMLELRQLMSRLLPDTWFSGDTGQTPSGGPSFSLANGPVFAARYFAAVDVRRHRSDLRVDELEPLMNYIRSCFPGRAEVDEGDLAPMAAHLERHIADQGAYQISKEVGIIIGCNE